MAGAAKGKVAKTASKNNPSSRKAARKMFFNNVQVKAVRIIGFEATVASGQKVKLGSYMAIANFQTDALLVDANGVPFDFKYAVPEGL